MRHITDNNIEHGSGSGIGIDPSGDGPIGSKLSSETKGGIDDGHKVIDPTHGGIRKGEMFVAMARSDVGKSVFNEDHNDINSQSERFYAKANDAFLSEGWKG